MITRRELILFGLYLILMSVLFVITEPQENSQIRFKTTPEIRDEDPRTDEEKFRDYMRSHPELSHKLTKQELLDSEYLNAMKEQGNYL